MDPTLNSSGFNLSLRSKIRAYKLRMLEVKSHLDKKPEEWGRFQSEFNQEINGIFRDIMIFEKENLGSGNEERLYKLKNLFIRKIRKDFLFGDYITWSLKKPYGYAGDFKIIEDIYRNSPQTQGFGRLYDNYFMHSAISIAVRNRKDDFKRFLKEYLKNITVRPLRVMVLGAGPGREILELATESPDLIRDTTFDCYDYDQNAIEFLKDRLSGKVKIVLKNENIVKFALKKNINGAIGYKYDFIYSTGLFDYFDNRIIERLLTNLRLLLNQLGQIVISDVRDKYSNPSVHFMEWVGEWSLVYRDDDNFRALFSKAGFHQKELLTQYEQQGILQYILATLNGI